MDTLLTVFIIEDNFFFRKKVKNYLMTILEENRINYKIEIVIDFYTFYNNIHSIVLPKSSIFIIDIDLDSSINGIDIAKQVENFFPKIPLIFLTAQEYKVLDVINSGSRPIAFIIKDLNEEKQFIEIKNTIESVIKNYIKNNQPNHTIFVKYKGKKIVLNYEDICYITTIKRERGKVLIQLIDQQIICSKKFNDLKKSLDPLYFVTDLKFLIINLANIKEIDRSSHQITFSNNKKIDLGLKIIDKISKRLQSLLS